MIEVMKASAGSGKTSRLTEKYIFILLHGERYAYRHTLAVTFTNKATDEMKSRILEELYILAKNPGESKYREDIEKEGFPGGLDGASRKAGIILKDILHDYSAFSISTIDAFFQMALKAFSREIGQFADYQVELDKEALVRESVDRILDSLSEDKSCSRMLLWLTDNALSKLGKGEKYKMEDSLFKIAKRLRDEQHRSGLENLGIEENELYSPEAIEQFGKRLREIRRDYILDFRKDLSVLDRLMADAGFSPEDTTRKFMQKPWDKVHELDEKNPPDNLPELTEAFIRTLDGPESGWFAKKNASLASCVSDELRQAFRDVFHNKLFEDKVYPTATILCGQIYSLGVAADISREFKALLKEKNVMCLDDSNVILKDIINGTDTPFIYEKLGVRYEHFLLDEFQDTSRIQWDNFVPLLKESLSNADDAHPEGRENLIVGDVKQSIYRWRDSDWKLLQEEVEDTFKGYVRQSVLGENWRSLENIVRFNGDFFSWAASELSSLVGAADGRRIADIYADVRQQVASRGPQGKTDCKGRLEFVFTDKENECETTYRMVDGLVREGLHFSDIGILTRTNNEGAEIAGYLISKGIPVVTDDSLYVSSSIVIRRLVALLSSVDDPSDTLSAYLARTLNISFPDSWLSLMTLCGHLLRQLREYDRESFDSEILYIQSFMDFLKDFITKHGNSLHSFLEAWKESGAKISSPSGGDSVRVMTIHKSKGLAFGYVIVPFLESVPFSRNSNSWCHPSVENTALEGVAKGVYDVLLSKKDTAGTLFEDQYNREYMLRLVDNLNVVYVAFTRAKTGLGVISDAGKSGNFANLLKEYMDVNGEESGFTHIDGEESGEEIWRKGEYPVSSAEEKAGIETIECGFPSWILGDRLKFNPEGDDFFDEEGNAGISSSRRLRGIVLHDILSAVVTASDLDEAVSAAVDKGALPAESREETKAFLEKRISEVSSFGWYPENRALIRTEVSLIDTDGEVYRPDRVIDDGEKVVIVDYKFGGERTSYRKKMEKYSELYRRMGRKDVSAYLWYVDNGRVL